MAFTVNGDPDRIAARLQRIVRSYVGSVQGIRNIHQNVHSIRQDRWGNCYFEAESTSSYSHDCAVIIRVNQSSPGRCIVEVEARDLQKCDTEGHVQEIENSLEYRYEHGWCI